MAGMRASLNVIACFVIAFAISRYVYVTYVYKAPVPKPGVRIETTPCTTSDTNTFIGYDAGIDDDDGGKKGKATHHEVK